MKPIPQEYFDENRELFDAETSVAPLQGKPCAHEYQRISATEVICRVCRAGWLDSGEIWPN